VILESAARGLLPLLLLVSLFVLLRGHNEPGGGFVGGLVAAAAVALVALASGVDAARRVLRVSPLALVGAGLSLALGAGLAGLVAGRPFLAGLWLELPLPVVGKLGTPVVFDVGVYLVVVGITLTILLPLLEE
jgi:multicomponent Na+:H+ antiporter subunit B